MSSRESVLHGVRPAVRPARPGAFARSLAALVLLLACGVVAQAQNPLARKAAPVADAFARSFAGDELSLVLEVRGQGYTGTASIDGGSYPLTARRDGNRRLVGHLSVDGEAYAFEARLDGDRLVLESEGERYELTVAAPPATSNPLARRAAAASAAAPVALDGVYDGPVDVLRHPDGYFSAEAPEGWRIAQVGDDGVLIDPGLSDTLDCLLFVTFGELDEDERGVDVVTLFEQGESELIAGLAEEGITVERAAEPPRKVAVGPRAGAEQVWSGSAAGSPVTIWCGALVEREYSLAVIAVMLQGKQDRFLPGVKRLFRSLVPKAPQRNLALERALAGARFSNNDTTSSGSFSVTYEFYADGSVKSESMLSGMIGIDIDVGANTEDWGSFRTAGPLLYMQFQDGQYVARVETGAGGEAVALLMGEARYHRR